MNILIIILSIPVFYVVVAFIIGIIASPEKFFTSWVVKFVLFIFKDLWVFLFEKIKYLFFISTKKRKIIAGLVMIIGVIASFHTIASYYKLPDKNNNNFQSETANNSYFSVLKKIDENQLYNNEYTEIKVFDYRIKINPSSFFYVITNPVNMIFSLVMIFLFFVDIKTLGSERHKDFKSSISSIGILGTFVGLFVGLLSFDTNNIEKSIPYLLDGLKTSFFTSVVGLSLSTILDVYKTVKKYETK